MSAGRLRVQDPSGPPFFSECSSVFRAPGLGPGGRRWKSCHSDQFQIAAVVEYMRHPSSKRNDAGGNPVGSAIARWCQSSTGGLLSRLSWCESKSGSQFQGSWTKQTIGRRSPSASRFTFLSRSSKAERPPDKRKTAERYRAGRPAFALRASARRAAFPE